MIQENCQSLFQTRLASDGNSFSLGLIGSIFLVQLSICFMLLLVIYHPRFANMSFRQRLLSIWKMTNMHGPDSERAIIVDEDVTHIFFDHVSYSENGILRFSNITWKVYKNTLTLVLGPNSSGKTTLEELIVGYRSPDSGNIYIKQFSASELKRKCRDFVISYCPQTPQLFEELTVYELFEFWAKVRCVPKVIIKNLIISITKEIDLYNEINKMVKHLSEISIKKVNIAISIIGYPDLIVLDDPLTNLDPLSQKQMMALINAAKDNGSTVILSSTELTNLYDLVDNVMILNQFQIEYEGPLARMHLHLPMGYYLTIIYKEESGAPDFDKINIFETFRSKFHTLRTVTVNTNFTTFYIPAEDNRNINYNFIVLEMDTILERLLFIEQYIITFNFMKF